MVILSSFPPINVLMNLIVIYLFGLLNKIAETGWPINNKNLTSSQDGSIDRYTLPPCATKKEGQQQIKKKKKTELQKIKLYGSPTTKSLEKKHSSRLVGGTEMGSHGGEDSQHGSGWWTRQGSDWQSRWPHICMWINREEQLGSETDHTTQGSSTRKASKPLTEKNLWGLRWQEKFPASQKSSLKRPTGS